MKSTSAPEKNVGGRPRHFDPDTERDLLVRATKKLLRARSYDEINLADILATSGLHTRAFYRHFASKDHMLLWIYEENGQELGRILETRVAAAGTAAEAVVAWIDEMLRLRFDPRSVEHVAIFNDPAAKSVVERLGVPRVAKKLMITPLLEAIERGRRDGTVSSPLPHAHASFIWSLVWGELDWVPGARRGREEPKSTARRVISTFVLRGTGP